MTIERYPITDRLSWLEWRRQDLTASAVAAAVGLDPYCSPLRLYAEKTGQILSEAETGIMRRGRWLESAAVDAIREDRPDWQLARPNVYLRDPDLRLGATPDCLAEDPDEPGLINIQIKTVSKPTFERDWADGAVPVSYMIQTLTEGMLLDARTNYIAALVIDTYSAELVMREIPRHPEAEAKIRTIAVEFWNNVAEGKRPVPDYSRDAETISEIYKHPEKDLALDLSADNRLPEVLLERAALKAEIERDEARLKALDAEIKDKIGDAEAAELPGWRITWKEQTRKEYTVPAATYRVLRVTERNGEAA